MKLPALPSLLLLFNWALVTHSIEVQAPLSQSSSNSTSSLLSLHKSLVEINSITTNEYNVGRFLVSYLKKNDFTVEIQEVTPATPSSNSRQNILAYKGKQRQTRILVSSHIDTVPPYWPYERKGDEIWGRGSVDAKGSVASQITAVKELLAAGTIREGDVALLFVVGEEVDAIGMKTANELGLSWETVIFGEPTELKLASGHKGNIWARIAAHGIAGHSGYPQLGRNANAMLARVLYTLDSLDFPSSEKYGNTTLNIGRVEGGVAANVIAEEAFAEIAVRIAAGSPDVIRKLISDTIAEAGEGFEARFSQGYGPVYIDSDVKGFDTIVVNYGTDIPYLQGSHKRYLYGPGDILVAHSGHEHLTVSDLETAVKGYKALIEHSLK